jgi:serine/threonine-protein kinase
MNNDFLTQFSQNNYKRIRDTENAAISPNAAAANAMATANTASATQAIAAAGTNTSASAYTYASSAHSASAHSGVSTQSGAAHSGATHSAAASTHPAHPSTPHAPASPEPAPKSAAAREARERVSNIEKYRSPGTGPVITAPEHEVEVDRSYSKRKTLRTFLIAVTVIILALAGLYAFNIMNQVTLKNFVGTPLNDAKTWGISNKITIEVETHYSLEQENDHIISQNHAPGQTIQKGAVLTIQVSKGPDPDERLHLPNFTNMTSSQLSDWKTQHKATNANIMQEYSETIATGQYIRKEFNNTAVTESNYTRKDSLLIYISKGPAAKNIEVPDFKEKAKAEVTAWAGKNDIETEFTEAASDKIPKDMVISQSISPGEKIAAQTKITITLSQGKTITIPNFSTLTKEEAGAQSDIAVTVKTRYSATVPYGKLISQSQPAGKKLTDETPKVTVIYSEGEPYIDNLVGKTEKDLQSYFFDLTSKGANITYNVVYVDSSEPKGQVVWASPKSQFVGMTAHVTVHVSRENLKKEEAGKEES